MARIEWAQVCELAFLDGTGRLCLVGITTRLPVPSLPLAVYQLMMAAQVVDVGMGEEIDVEVWLTTPSGLSTTPSHPNGLNITVAGDYLLVTLRDIPLTEEGVYRFSLSVDQGTPVTFNVPVLLISTPEHVVVQ